MANLCELKVTGKTSGTVVVANTILRGKVSRPVGFSNISQLKGALALERAKIISIAGELPEEVKAKLDEEGRNRFENQEIAQPTDAPFEGELEAAPFEAPSTEKPEEEEVADSEVVNGEFPTPSTEKDEDPTLPAEDAEVESFATPSTENPEEETPGVTREQIIDMTAAEMKSHIKANDVKITGISKMNATQLTNALLAAYGEEEMTEEEAAK